MPKVCGFMTMGSRPEPEVLGLLRNMLEPMKHDPEQAEAYACFPGGRGGIGALQYPFETGSNVAWDTDRHHCVGLAGQIVGASDHASGPVVFQRSEGETVCDALVRAWKISGADLPRQLNGVFSLVAYDHSRRSLTLASDRYGLYPLYYRARPDGLFFASEVKGVLPAMSDADPDWEGWADFFYTGQPLGTRTLVKDVRRIDSGELVRYEDGEVSSRKYFDLTRIAPLDRNQVSVDEFAARFNRAVRSRIDNSLPQTILLSGGFDSRLTLGALHAHGVAPRVISLLHAEECRGLDGALAAKVARSLGLQCELRPARKQYYESKEWREVFDILDGMIPNRDLFISQVYPELDSSMGVVWDGLGGGIAIGGFHGWGDDAEANMKRFSSGRSVYAPVLETILDPEAFRALDLGFTDRLRSAFDAVPQSPNRFILFLVQNRLRRRIAINPYQLYASKVRMTSATADANVLDYALAVPNTMKDKHRFYLDLLRRHFPGLVRFPVISSGDIFLSSKDPLLVLRHYQWQREFAGWLSERPWLRAPLALVRKVRSTPQRGSAVHAEESSRDRRLPWLRSDGGNLPGAAAGVAQRAVMYMGMWQELIDKSEKQAMLV